MGAVPVATQELNPNLVKPKSTFSCYAAQIWNEAPEILRCQRPQAILRSQMHPFKHQNETNMLT